MHPDFENLVFEGGGTKGSAYAGCVEVIEKKGILKSVKRVAGTSAGSITATLLACGSGSSGLFDAVRHTDFKKFIDDSWGVIGDAKRTFTKYGMHTGDPLVKTLKKYIHELTGDQNLTFSKLRILARSEPSKFKELSVVASNLTRQQPQIFSADHSPELQIWESVRASVSIPMIFEPVIINEEYFVDGSLSWIYPVNIYDLCETDSESGLEVLVRNPKTLGFYLEPQSIYPTGKKFNPTLFNINSFGTFLMSMGYYMFESANYNSMCSEDIKRTVFIDDLGVSATTFSTSEKKIEALIQSGRKATEEFFS